ncbi:MAG: hypothetical protein QM784_02845 [Polyangiaceae bacterium]
MSVLAVASFAWVAEALGLRRSRWLAVGLAFTPLYWIHSVDSMDFAWAMAFAWLGLGFALRGNVHRAGIAIGLAVGCRLTEVLVLIPAVLLCCGSTTIDDAGRMSRSVRASLRFRVRMVLVSLTVSAFCYFPVAHVYGTRALRVYESGRVPWTIVLHRSWVELWGIPGTIGLVAAVAAGALFAVRTTARQKTPHVEAVDGVDAMSLRAGVCATAKREASHIEMGGRVGATSLHGREHRRMAFALSLPILGFWILFLRLPHDAGYLLSTVPYVLLLVGVVLPPISSHLVVVSLLLSNLPVGPIRANTVWGAEERRRSQVKTVRRWTAQLRRETEPMVLVAGTYQPKLLSELRGERLSAVEIRYLLRADEAAQMKTAGRRIL